MATAAWVVLSVVSVLVGGHTFGQRLAGKLLDTAATVAFAIAGLGLIVERWQRREWERRTRYLVHTLLDEAVDELAEFADRLTCSLLRGLTDGQRKQIPEIRAAFRLPLADRQEEAMRGAAVATKSVFLAVATYSEAARLRAEAAQARRTEVWEASIREELQRQDARIAQVQGKEAAADDQVGNAEDELRDGDEETDALEPDEELEPGPATHSLPEGTLPFPLEPSAELVAGIVKRHEADREVLDEAAKRLYDRVIELSAYTPGQAGRLVSGAVDIRARARGLRKRTLRGGAEPPDSPADERAERHPRGTTRDAALEAAERSARETADEAAMSDFAWGVASETVAGLREMFLLLRELDAVYRLRLRDSARGIDLGVLEHLEGLKQAGDRADRAVDTVSAAAARMTAQGPAGDQTVQRLGSQRQSMGSTEAPSD